MNSAIAISGNSDAIAYCVVKFIAKGIQAMAPQAPQASRLEQWRVAMALSALAMATPAEGDGVARRRHRSQ